ncbi:helix-turn-helix transcriptional regulator [Streptomyces sp. CA-278952]|uniref:helix-turn-helix domain-containing protein n=1 Tax=Streptomyces sp. CA-278952 TaxID=2980556 RepID=UPI002367E9C8|nr:helix-turn-helix transcriptional regulator [Streptomyces sp. CA-278952]WDG31058.1 helix-turn-helix transcriptional regulator [Streptomyces sp. CA-278952]
MPKRSHKWKELRSSVPPGQRAFVLMLRKVREVSDRTQAQIAGDVYLAPTSLSNHFNGGRIPEAEHVEKLYKILDDEAATSSRPMPCSLPLLLELRDKALVKHCDCCAAGSPAAAASSPEAQPTVTGSPAPKPVRRRPRRPRVRLSTLRHSIPRAPAQTKVPVPLRGGDRHLTTPADAAWPEIRTLAASLSDGRSRDADIMMWSAATTLSARDVQIFVAHCRAVGMEEAADQVITNVARRDAQAVLNIASALHDSEQYADAGLLLAAAAQED